MLWFEREHLSQLTDNCEWKVQNFLEKWRKSKPNELKRHLNMISKTETTREFFWALFLLLVGWGPERSMPIEELGSPSLVSSIFQREGKLHCSLTGRKLWIQVNIMLTSLIYVRACVNKNFVHSGSIGLMQGKHARYVIIGISRRV